MNATSKPIYNKLHGPSSHRFDLGVRKLDGTEFAKEFGATSASCFPHGILGQSYDDDHVAVSGKQDNYKDVVEVTTTAMAEGAIEGSADNYVLAGPFDTIFKYSRFAKKHSDKCAPRDVSKLSGFKAVSKGNIKVASTSEDGDAKTAAPVKQE